MTRAELSRLAGVSKPAVTQAIKRGLLFLTNGEIDANHPKTKAYLSQASGRRIAATQEKKARTPTKPSEPMTQKSAEKPRPSELSAPKTPEPKARSERRDKPKTSEGETFEEAQLREKIERADKLALENRQKRGELIQVSLVHSFLSRLYAIDTSQFLTRGDRIAATCAGAARAAASDDEASVRVNDLLTSDAYTEQAFKKKLIQDFLKSQKMKDDITHG